MKKHTGLRPLDIPILVKVFILQDGPWLMKEVANSLYISPSEVSESLHRSKYAGLIDDQKERVLAHNFLEFLFYGVRYVFPQQPGPITRGIPTAHSHPSFSKKFISDLKFIWPYSGGKDVGVTIEPFYLNQVKAALQDEKLYIILALIDVIRIGKVREVTYAKDQLRKLFRLEQ